MCETHRYLGPGATGDIDHPEAIPTPDGYVEPTDPETPPATRPEPTENEEAPHGTADR